MTDFVEYIPKRHGRLPPYWMPDMEASLDGNSFVRQDWAWIAGTTYYVPYEAVHGRPRAEAMDKLIAQDADLIDTCPKCEALQADNAKLREANAKLREALAGLTTDAEDDPCWFDHNGNCQAHFITNPCEMAFARAALQETER